MPLVAARKYGNDDLAALVKSRRAEVGLTQPELAAAAHLSFSTISKIETGERNTTRESIDHIAHALSIPRDVLRKAAGHIDPGEAMRLETDEVELVSLYRKALPLGREATLAGLRVWARQAEEER